MGKAKIPNGLIPRYLKYSVAIMPLEDTQGFPDSPNPEWPKKDTLVLEEEITKVFEKFHTKIGFTIGPTSFFPGGVDGVKIYFNASKKNSLFIVAESEEIADSYAESLRLRKPYNAPKYKQEEESLPSW